MVFFLIVTFAIPGLFYAELFKEERDIGNVSVENRKLFNELIDYDTQGKKIPGIICQGEEFRNMKVRSKEELDNMMKIKASPLVQAAIPKEIEGR